VPKVRDAIELIEADGWREVTSKGSHRQFKHATKTGRHHCWPPIWRLGARHVQQHLEASGAQGV